MRTSDDVQTTIGSVPVTVNVTRVEYSSHLYKLIYLRSRTYEYSIREGER
jgi:hypothetical protein